MILGDMTVVGSGPAKMMKALAVIANTMHPAFDSKDSPIIPGKSKNSCVLASLTVRDFLTSIGFDATVRSVTCFMRAERGGKSLHSLGIGAPPQAYANSKVERIEEPGRWDGHLVCTVPKLKLMIDTTLYDSIRPAWAEHLTGMIALPYGTAAGDARLYGCRPIASHGIIAEDYRFDMIWLDRPDNQSWRKGGDATESWRRGLAVAALRTRFGAFNCSPPPQLCSAES